MRKLLLVLTILFTMLHAHLYAATFTASQIEITPGQTAQLVIGMNNTETNLSGFQFKLYLPEGLSVTTDTKGQFVYTQSGRIAKHTVNFRNLNDGGYLVVVYSMDADVITGSSGELMSISVTADETASTSGNGKLSNIRITDVTSSTNSCDDVTIDVTVLNAHPHDATFTASQIEITSGQTAQLVVGMNTTETNLSGFQFKLYLPKGLSVTTDTKGQFVYTQSGRIAKHTVNFRNLNDGGYLVVVYSMDADVITGSSGELMSISVTADETASTSGNGKLSNIRITDVTSSTSSCDDVPIDIIIVPKVHYVTFKYGETVYLHEQVAYGAAVPVPDNPTLKGHTFAGWTPDVPETMPDEDLVFTAVFTVNQYTATFTIPSEDWSEVLTLDYGSAITAPTPPTKPGYAFAGWDKPIPETMPDTDLVFTGTYTQNFQTLSLTATGNGSISYDNSSVRSSSQSFDVAELLEVVLTITPDTGHHVDALTINGEDALSQLSSDGKLSIGSMTASVTVAVTFAVNVIDFADAGVKALCVANWDTNGDGELSESEAAEVKSLNKAFKENKDITSFDEFKYFTGVESLGFEEFHDCSNLTSISLPNTLTSCGQNTFTGCERLSSIKWPENEKFQLGFGMFQGCTFTSITLPSNAIMDHAVFIHCNNLKEIIVDNANPYYQSIDGVVYSKDMKTIIAYPNGKELTEYTIPDGVETIYGDAFWGSIKLDNINIPTSVKTLRAGCFGCTNINSLIIPQGVTEIPEECCAWCENLSSVTIPESVTTIRHWAFVGCSSMSTVTLPESVTSIGSEVFGGCSGLTEVYCYAKQVPSTDSNAFSNTNMENAKLENATLYVPRVSIELYKATSPWSGFGTIVAIPGTDPDIAKIGSLWYAIDTETKQATVIESKDDEYSGDIVIPASVQYQDETYDVTEIDADAFNGCSGLTAVTIPNSVTGLPRFGFSGCNNLATVTLDCWAIISKVYPGQSSREFARLFGDQVKECIIGNSVTYIGNFFEDCSSIESITIGSNVEEIRFGAFRGCDLVSITVNAENSTYDSRDNCNAIIDTNNNILVLGCRNTVIPSSVKSIDARAFYRCSLTSITIPSSVTFISTEAFYGCSGLTNITSHIKEPFAIADDVFEGIPYETATLFVPGGTIDAYKATDGWKNFQNIEVIPQQLTIVAVGDGSVTFSGETLTKTTATFKVAGEVQLLLTPEEGCHIERVMVNHQDYTSQVTDGVLTLNVVDEDYFVLAEFEHDAVPEPTYVNYTIYFDGHGDVRVKGETLKESGQRIQVPQGSDLVLEFLPDEGQMVDKVTLNGETVTDQVVGNTLVVRDVQEDGTVSVIFMEQIETFEYAGIRYGVTDNTQRTLKVLPYDYSGHLSIPESIEHSQRTWQVQEIGNLAFANCEWLVSVKIPSSITKTGKNLFKRDTRLAAIQWDALLQLTPEVTGEPTNANMLYYVKNESYAPKSGNIIINGMADNIVLSDKHDFYCPVAFQAKRVSYSHNYRMLTRRGDCQGWESLVLPFDVKTIRLSRNPDNPQIYPFESLMDDEVSENKLPFWLYSYGDDDTFTPAASIEANTPYIISMPNDVVYLPVFRLAGDVTFSAQDESGVEIFCTSNEHLKVPGTQRLFQPSYQKHAVGNDCYLVNENDNSQFAEGSKFIQALRPARPFEAYMISQTASVKPWYDIFEQMPTGIRDIPAINDEEEMANGNKCYDLSGRQIVNSKLSNCKLHRGIYIINDKKQVIK